MGICYITTCSSKSYHRIFFMGFIVLTSFKMSIFIGFKISGSIDDRSRTKRFNEFKQISGQFFYIYMFLVVFNKLFWMSTNACAHKLSSKKTDTISIKFGYLRSDLWFSKINIYFS